MLNFSISDMSDPFQGALAPGVYEAEQQHGEEDHHFHEAGAAQCPKDHGPGEEKNRLHVKDDEEQGEDVIPDGEGRAAVADRWNAALVRGEFFR